MRAEYNAFFRASPRLAAASAADAPLTTDEEKRAWKATVDTDLWPRPTWGMEIRRRYKAEV